MHLRYLKSGSGFPPAAVAASLVIPLSLYSYTHSLFPPKGDESEPYEHSPNDEHNICTHASFLLAGEKCICSLSLCRASVKEGKRRGIKRHSFLFCRRRNLCPRQRTSLPYSGHANTSGFDWVSGRFDQDRFLIGQFGSQPLYTVFGGEWRISVSLSFSLCQVGCKELIKVKLVVRSLAHLAGSAL